MQCRLCQHENHPAAGFCGACGHALRLRRIDCGTDNAPDNRFCDSCGEPLQEPRSPGSLHAAPRAYTPPHLRREVLTSQSAREGERKQVTVMFCDLVNSTDLAQRLGANGMHRLLNSVFELALAEVHRVEGTIN